MVANDLRARMRAQPFEPFTVVLADGSQVPVHHHDYAWVVPTGGVFYVQDEQGTVHRIYTSHITSIIYLDPQEEPGSSVIQQP